MILLDPCSYGFSHPRESGYRLIFKNFEDYYNGMSSPSWHQWISYETKYLSKSDLVEITLRALESMILLEQKYSVREDPVESRNRAFRLFRIRSNRFLASEFERVSRLSDEAQRNVRIKELWNALNEYMNPEELLKKGEVQTSDVYGYRQKLQDLLYRSTGLIDGL